VPILSRERWDPAFFERLVALRAQLHRDVVGSLPEERGDLERYYGSGRLFDARYRWRALLAVDGERPLGRLVVSCRRGDGPPGYAAAGHFECSDDIAVARALFDAAAVFARECGAPLLKAPMVGSFFHSYRLRLAGDGSPFYGETVAPDSYHRLLQQCGLQPAGRWTTLALDPADCIEVGRQIRAHHPLPPGVTIRPARFDRYRDELRLLHELLTASYRGMREFSPIGLDEFEELYADFRHVTREQLVQIAECDGRACGFMISLFDPLPALIAHRRARYPGRSLVTLWRLRRASRRLLILYLGKVGSTAAPVKGLTAHFFGHIGDLVQRFGVREVLACNLVEGSPTFATLPAQQRTHSISTLYQRELA
jgi:hypothetical protein